MADGKPGDTTIKILFAMSGNVCAFRENEGRVAACEEWLTDPEWKSVKARICHIAGRRPDSARYDESMTDEERAHFDNLILMCPTHHVLIDELEPDRFTVEILHDMKSKALVAHGPRMGVQQWATDADLDRFVRLAAAAMQRHYAGEEASVTYDVTATARTTVTGTASATVEDEFGHRPARRDGSGFAGTTGFSNPDGEKSMDRYAIQVRQVLGYDNVLSVDDSVEPGRLDIATNWLPTDLEFDQLGDLVTGSGLNIIVTSQGQQRRLP